MSIDTIILFALALCGVIWAIIFACMLEIDDRKEKRKNKKTKK